MAVPVHIPKLGMAIENSKLVEWKVQEAGWVEKGDIVLVIETEKISNEIEAAASGFLHIVIDAGAKVNAGDVVGLICETEKELETVQKDHRGEEGKAMEAARTASENAAEAAAIEVEETVAPLSQPAGCVAAEPGVAPSSAPVAGSVGGTTEANVDRLSKEEARPRSITPLAEKMLRQAGLDISRIAGTGEGGKITKEDVKGALEGKKEGKGAAPYRIVPLIGMRRSIADNMYASLHTTAQLTTFTEVDATEMVRLRDMILEEYNGAVKISYNDIIVMATAKALKEFPIMNSNLVGDEILLFNNVHMGIAVALPEGLIVPVLRDADKMGLFEISRRARELVQKARDGKLTIEDLTGGTFTVSNGGTLPVDGVTPILKPPETGILATSRLKEKPVVYEGQIAVRTMMNLSLTYDHRVVDGAPAAEFTGALVRFIENPRLLLT